MSDRTFFTRLLAVAAFLILLMAAATNTINWTQLISTDRHGTSTKGQASDGTGATGHLATYTADGSLTDGGATTTLTAPVQGNWSNLNTASMTLAPTYQTGNYFEMASRNTGSIAVEGLFSNNTFPTAPYTRTFRVIGWLGSGTAAAANPILVGWGDGTKHFFLQAQSIGATGGAFSLFWNVVQYSNNSGGSETNPAGWPPTGVSTHTTLSSGVPTWIQLIDDNTNWTVQATQEASPSHYLVLWKGARNTFLTATQFEVAVNNDTSSQIQHLIFDSFQ